MYFLRKLTDTIIYSNFFIGICAVALALTNQLTVESDIHFDRSLWFVFFSTLFTYSFLKFRKTGSAAHTTHHNWADEHPQWSRNILLISLIATVIYFRKLHGQEQWVVAQLALLTAFYGFVNIPFTNPKRKLRDFGLIKTIFVAIVWSVTTVVVPLGDTFVERDMMVFLLLRRFIFILALTIPFEIKDMAGDREYNLKTIPLMFGVGNTKLLAQAILFVLMLILSVQYLFFDILLSNMLAINFSLLVSIICIQPLKEETTDYWYYIVLDGMMILQCIIAYVSVKIW